MFEPRRMRSSPATRAGVSAGLLRAAPWVIILLLTGGFHLLRGASVDAGIFLGVGVLLAADAALGPLRPGTLEAVTLEARPVDSGPGTTGRAPSWIVTFGVLIGIVLALAPRYSPLDAVAVGGLGLLLVPLIWPEPWRARADARPPLSPRPPALRRAATLWSVLAVIAAGWELLSYFLGMPSAAAAIAHPALSDVVGPLANWAPTRAICVGLWLLGGYALLRRGPES